MEDNNPWVGVLVAAVFVLIGLGISINGVDRASAGEASRSWPATGGQITASSVGISMSDDGTEYSPDVSYIYQVEGREYDGSRISFGGTNGGEEEAIRYTQRYPIGKKVSVYYDPSRPERAVLEPGSCTGCEQSLTFLGSVALIALLVFFIYLRSARTREEAPE